MANFFKEHREEVVGASIWEFNQELNDQAKYEDGYDDGREDGIEVGIEKGHVASIKSLMQKLKMTAEQAMDALGIPEDEKIKYNALIKS